MCGIVGIVGTSPVNQQLYDALTVLQHRGQDAAGIATVDEHAAVRAQGQRPGARRVPAAAHAASSTATSASATCAIRPPAAKRLDEAQPFYVNAPYGIASRTTATSPTPTSCARGVVEQDRRHLNTDSDSEVLLNVFAARAAARRHAARRRRPTCSARSNGVYRRCRGGYAVVAMIIGHGLLGFRDPHGIRPLVLGKRETPKRHRMDARLRERRARHARLRARARRRPGRGDVHRRARRAARAAVRAEPCGTRPASSSTSTSRGPDSIIDNISVHKARMRMGEKLAREDPAPSARTTTSTS